MRCFSFEARENGSVTIRVTEPGHSGSVDLTASEADKLYERLRLRQPVAA